MNPTVLLVDDELIYREHYGAALAQAGFNVIYAKDGEEAITKIQAQRPDFLIVDFVMPIISGLSLLKKIRRKRIPTIVLTHLEGQTDREDALALGAKEFCTKSEVSPGLLAKKVQRLFS